MKERLHAQIQHLHDVLEESALDESQISYLKQVSDDVKTALSEDKTDIYQQFGTEMEKSALEFEERHPAITQVIKEILRTLRNAGI